MTTISILAPRGSDLKLPVGTFELPFGRLEIWRDGGVASIQVFGSDICPYVEEDGRSRPLLTKTNLVRFLNSL